MRKSKNWEEKTKRHTITLNDATYHGLNTFGEQYGQMGDSYDDLITALLRLLESVPEETIKRVMDE